MSVENTPFLRNVLYADALVGGAAAGLTILASDALATLLMLPQPLIFWAGVALLPVVAFLIAMARRAEIPRTWLLEIVVLNAAWAMASLAILAAGIIQPNMLGAAFVIAQALAVGLFGVLEAMALRQDRVARA